MDFVERLFGLSPDGGSGTLEALLIFLAAAAAIAPPARKVLARFLNAHGNGGREVRAR